MPMSSEILSSNGFIEMIRFIYFSFFGHLTGMKIIGFVFVFVF